MISENYANAYKEVIEVLKTMERVDVNKIPRSKILLYKNNMNKKHDFSMKPNKTLGEQGLSTEAKAILANLFIDYWATDYQREKIKQRDKYELEQIEKEKYEKYNPDNIFKNRKQNAVVEETITNTTSMVEYKESIFKKIINKIKDIFKR